MLTVAFLSGMAFLAGLIDSVAGGGGLLSVPALALVGVPPQQMLATSKFSSTLGTTASLINFARSGAVMWKLCATGVAFAMLGSAAGARLLVALDPNFVGKCIAALLPVGILATLLPKKDITSDKPVTRFKYYFGLPLICFIVGGYDGFFGPGAGSFYIMAFHYVIGIGLVQASASTKVFNLASNIGGLVVFVLNSQVVFQYGLPMALANVAGNLVGSRLTIKGGPKVVRRFLVFSLSLLFLSLLWKYALADFF